MGQTPPTLSEAIPVDEKRQALERVLASHAFSRSDQLRAFLRYICEAEFEGRAHTLNEYSLGVSVLGRPESYSPAEDSCVRSRAYELRHKLKSYYRLEAPSDPVRIDIRKGAYAPQFRRLAAIEEQEEATSALEPEPAAAEQAAQPRAWRRAAWAAAVVLALGAGLALGYWLYSPVKPAPLTAEMTEFWKPLMGPGEPLVICYERRLFFFGPEAGLVVRDSETNRVEDAGASALLNNFRKRLNPGNLTPVEDYADSGAVPAAYLLGRLLGPRLDGVSLKPSTALSWHDIWNGNVLFLGKPNLDPSIRYLLRNEEFRDSNRGVVILHPRPGEQPEYLHATTHGEGVKYALITLAPGPQSGHSILALSGVGSELMWALAQAVTDPVRVKELVSRLRRTDGSLPSAYQVLIRATFQGGVPVEVRYVTHRAATTP